MDDNTLESQGFSQPCRKLEFDIEIDGQEANKQLDDQEASQDVPVNTDEKLVEEPKLGMEFACQESAYEFYNSYANKIGFSVRKSSLKKTDDGVICKRLFCCSKEGRRRENKRIGQPKVIRAITRTECLAGMTIRLRKNGKYHVTKFVAEHNHEVATAMKVHMLRSHRGLTNAKKTKAIMVDDSRITLKAADYKNYLRRKRMKVMEKGDAGAVLEYFQKMKVDDPSFFYAIQVDEDDQITNMFWADGKSIVDYSVFGDVVCFDTTYRLNSYERPFASFVGVNHHKQTIIFGAALLYDETIESFKWLFQTFLSAMSGKQPMTILTDQDTVMANAIASVMPAACHRLCVWHIYQLATKHLSHVFNGSQCFEYDFTRCMYDYEVEEEFLTAWNNMLEKYDLMQNKWLQDLFKEREKWALVYGRNTFCADMKSTQQSETVNSVLKKYLNSKYNILCFFTHYEQVVADLRYQESIADFKMKQSTPVMFLDVKMLKEAAKVYTPKVFEMFQDEYKKILSHSIFKRGEFGTVAEFRIIYSDKDEGHTVRFDSLDDTVMCSCKKFEFVGILCSHALKVLDCYNVKVLHPRYILKRWQRDAKVGFATNHNELTIQGDRNVMLGKRYNYLYHKLLKIAAMAGEYEEVFKFADRYADKFHDEVMECLKSINEPPVMLSQVVDESVDIEHACSEPTESVDTDHVRPDRTESVGTESARLELIEKQLTFVDTVSGIKEKFTVGGRHHSQLDKVRKKGSRTESVQPQANQERHETALALNIMQPASFQPSHYPISFPQLSNFNQGSYIVVVSPFGLPSGFHAGYGQHMVMGFTPGPSGSINASLAQPGLQPPNVCMLQQNPFNIG
ncbi:protein FAR1-RELATED SEQUENCE 5-like [Magnolia sinica]|uniref:protein FAR1-RELATED SEQUENCE 5-like n=1 Tax=Magnolia sinica TaxID=86752 RepID=UPI00265A1534|nr:protein FAR1-RELATED SEQUENCE 5-like [Magnolia sinica]XP_058078168.1 protein FAR1-RELATED SEQUENCE 5-like [Magnolia sinica]